MPNKVTDEGKSLKAAMESALFAGASCNLRGVFPDYALADCNGKTWRVPYTTDGKGYAFGKAEVVEVEEAATPDPPAKPEAAEVRDLTVLQVLEAQADDKPGERTVVLIESGDNPDKRRSYTNHAVESAVKLYEGKPMYLDHAGTERKPAGVRALKDMAARVLKTWTHVRESGTVQVRAKIHGFDTWLNERLGDQHFRDLVGLSHDAQVMQRRERRGGKLWDVMESIADVRSVDFVSRAAFGGRVLESDPLAGRTEDVTMLETITIDDLKQHRPDLVTALEGEVKAAVALESADNETTAQLEAVRKENETLRAQITEAATSQAVAEAVKEVPEAARERVAQTVTAHLKAAGPMGGDALKTAAKDAVTGVLETARAVAGKPKPSNEEGDPPTTAAKLTPLQELQIRAAQGMNL